MRHPSPAQRLGRTANLVIFLGLLYTVLHLLGFLGLLHGYHLPGLVIALGLLGLGYGIRYGSSACLYAAMTVCAGLSLYCGVLVVSAWTPYYMQLLQQEGAFPLPMSRYGVLFLRQVRGRATQKRSG